MDSITLAGSLEGKLHAVCDAGLAQIMLWGADLAGHPGGLQDAVRLVRASGLRITGLQVLRDFEGQEGAAHDYKLEIAQQLLQACHAIKAPLLLVCSSTAAHATGSLDVLARDLAGLATIAAPLGVKIGYEALPWARHVNLLAHSWDVVDLAAHPNLGVVVDAFHVLACPGSADCLDDIPSGRVFLVQLSDFLAPDLAGAAALQDAARHGRVFPGQGGHARELADLLRRLDQHGYRGDYSFEVCNDDFLQLPAAVVAQYAHRSARWVTDQVLQRSLAQRRRTVRHPSLL
jgi:sugar phosphate isomerase/epimerase